MISKIWFKIAAKIFAPEWFDFDREEKMAENSNKWVFSPMRKIYVGQPGDICPKCGHDVSGEVFFCDSGEPDFASGGICPDCGAFSTDEQWENTTE